MRAPKEPRPIGSIRIPFHPEGNLLNVTMERDGGTAIKALLVITSLSFTVQGEGSIDNVTETHGELILTGVLIGGTRVIKERRKRQ
jgi:hypothetical protein